MSFSDSEEEREVLGFKHKFLRDYLPHAAKSEVTGDLLVAVEDLADDLVKAVDGYRDDGRF